MVDVWDCNIVVNKFKLWTSLFLPNMSQIIALLFFDKDDFGIR